MQCVGCRRLQSSHAGPRFPKQVLSNVNITTFRKAITQRIIHKVPTSCSAHSAGDAEPPKTSKPPAQGPLQWILGLFKRGVKLLLGVLVIAALSIAAAPAVISTEVGGNAAAAAISAFIPGQVSVQRIDVGWTGKTCVEGISVTDNLANAGDVEVLHIDKICSEASLADMFTGNKRRTVVVTGVRADMAPLATNNAMPRLLAWATRAQQTALMRPLGPPSSHPILPEVHDAAVNPPYTEVQSVPVSAHLFGPNLEVFVEDSGALVAAPLAKPLSHVHLSSAVGMDAVQEAADEAHDTSLVSWARDKLGSNSANARKPGLPLVAEFDSGFTRTVLKGWLTGFNVLLEQPIAAQVSTSDTVLMEWIATVNPTLCELMRPQQEADIAVRISTPDMMLPSESFIVDIAPMRLQAVAGPSLSRLATNIKRQVAALSAAEGKASIIEAWLGPMRVSCHADGAFELSRLDMRLGSGDNALHVAVWGTGNTYTQDYDFNIAMKPELLRRWSSLPKDMAERVIPDDYMLVFPARSTGGRGLDLDLAVARRHVQQFIADCAHAQLNRAFHETSSAEGKGALRDLLGSSIGKFVEEPSADLFQVEPNTVPVPLTPRMPWNEA